MNIVTHIKYQNFLAAGNVPIEVDLTQHATTLVIGKNGAGKSTLHEAICFAWFGRPLRKINKPSLVNWINTRDCLVELDWRLSNGTQYKVRRGIKPAVFEIFKNDVLEPVPANLDDYQSHLESVIKLNHKSFMQVVVLGGSSYVPFMRLASAARRGIIEDLLDIEVFSSMNVLAKEDLTEVKTAIDTNQTTCRLLDQQVKMAQSFEHQIEEDTKARIDVINATIETTTKQIEALHFERAQWTTTFKTYEPFEAAERAAAAKKTEYETMLYKLKARTDKETEKTLSEFQSQKVKDAKERAFYAKHDDCPTCEQSITKDFKTKRFAALDAMEKATDASILECQKRLTAFRKQTIEAVIKCAALIYKYEQAQAEANTQLGTAREILSDIKTLDAKLSLHRRRLTELEQERLKVLTPKPTAPHVDVNALLAQLSEVQKTLAGLSETRVILDAATMLLKDSGIKTRIIRHYLPIINKFIHSYLTAMNFPIVFTFDEEFEDHIKTAFGEGFSYEQFSDGEKKRIDLALLLTWRAVARLKNSASTNLLVLDEVFDSSLDLTGMDEFLTIIHGLEKDANVFVMSHRVDQLIEKFAHTIVFEKVRGFSQVKT